MNFKTGVGSTFAYNMDDTGNTPNITTLCVVTITPDWGEGTDSFTLLCDEGFTQELLTTLAPKFAIELKADVDDAGIMHLLGLRSKVGERNLRDCEFYDSVTGETIKFKGSFVAIGEARTTEEVVAISVEVAMNGAPSEIIAPAKATTKAAQ